MSNTQELALNENKCDDELESVIGSDKLSVDTNLDQNVELFGAKTFTAGRRIAFNELNIELSYQRQNILRLKLPENPKIKEIICFPWSERWLRGYEYEFILKHYKLYCKKFGFQTFDGWFVEFEN